MNKIFITDFHKLVDPERKGTLLLVRDIITRFSKKNAYIPFKTIEELDDLIYTTCIGHDWDPEKGIAIYSSITPMKNKGDYGSCMIIADYSLEEVLDLVARVLDLKAFL